MVTDALRQALQVRRRGENSWAPAGLVHHSDAGSQGGFKRLSQHLDQEVLGGTSAKLGHSGDRKAGDAVARASTGSES